MKVGNVIVGVVRNIINESDLKSVYLLEKIDNKYLSREEGV